jgi:hypothetical protein
MAVQAWPPPASRDAGFNLTRRTGLFNRKILKIRSLIIVAATTTILSATMAITLGTTGASAATAVRLAATAPKVGHQVVDNPAGAAASRAVKPAAIDGICYTYQNITMNVNAKTLLGRAWYDDCTGADECIPYAQIEERSPTDPDIWSLIGSEAGGDGCTPAGYALAAAKCTYTAGVTHTYRTRGLFTTFWADGSITSAAGPFYSADWTGNYACT